MPYALQRLSAPGSLAAGYQRGDEVHPSVVEAWGLTADDVSDERPDGPAEVPAVPRPADDTSRAAWVAYAVSRGMDPGKAESTDLAELMDAYPEDAPAETDRPADGARKADWVYYVHNHPQATQDDKDWATNDGTTKAELQAWAPRPADPAAESATEQANG